MSDIRFNQWLHQSGTGGVSQDHIGNIGIGTTNPSIVVSAANTAILNVGVITANNLFVNNAFNGDITGNVTGNISGATGTFSGNVDIADKIIHTGDTDTAMRFPADNTFAVDTAGSERLRILANGKIGIGTAVATEELHVIGDIYSDGGYFRTKTGVEGGLFDVGGNNGWTVDQHVLRGYTNGSERVRINSVGNMGIGGEPLPTSTGYDGATLHLRQSANSGGSALRMTNGSTGHTTSDGFYMGYWQDGHLYFYNQEAGHMIFGTNSTERLRINSTGLVSLGGEPSSGAGLLNLKPSSGDEYLKIRDAGDFNASLNGVALDIRNSANTASKDLVVRSQNLVLWQSGSEQLRITENGRVLINRTTATDQNITNLSSDVKLVVNGSTITKHGYKADVGTSYVSIPGASLGNESSVYIVTVQGNGGGNFHSTATYILCSGAYNKTFTQLGSASNHFGNGVIQAQLSSYSGTSSSVQARRSGSSGTCSVQVHMLKLI